MGLLRRGEGLSTSRVALIFVALSFFLSFFISVSDAQLVQLNWPEPATGFSNGGPSQITINTTYTALCYVSVPLTWNGYQYMLPEFFVFFLNPSWSYVNIPMWAAWVASPSQAFWTSSSQVTINNNNMASFIRIPPTVVPSNFNLGSTANIYFGVSYASYWISVNASVALPAQQNIAQYSFNQTSINVKPYTAEVVEYSFSYYMNTAYFFELCNGNDSYFSSSGSSAGVYLFFPQTQNGLSNVELPSQVASAPIPTSSNNFVTTGLVYNANFSISFNPPQSALWASSPIVVSSNAAGLQSAYAILLNNWNPTNYPQPQVTTYRQSVWYGSEMPLGSDVISVVSLPGSKLVIQLFLPLYGCYLTENDFLIYLTPNYCPTLAYQLCYAQTKGPTNTSNSEYVTWITDFDMNFVGGSQAAYTLVISSDSSWYQESYSIVVAISSTSGCGAYTFPPIPVPFPPSDVYSIGGTWQVLLPTCIAILLVFVSVFLAFRVATLKSRMENNSEYEPIRDSPEQQHSINRSDPPIPAPSYIAYNPNPTNREAVPQGAPTNLVPNAYPQSSLALYGIPATR